MPPREPPEHLITRANLPIEITLRNFLHGIYDIGTEFLIVQGFATTMLFSYCDAILLEHFKSSESSGALFRKRACDLGFAAYVFHDFLPLEGDLSHEAL